MGKALKPIVDFFVALATSVRNWRVGRGMEAETGAPLQAQSVLEAFLQRQREEAKAMAELNRRRWEQSKQDGAALAEALERSPHQIVLDDDGTPLKFHDPLTNRVPGMFYLEYKDGISNSTCLSALMLAEGKSTQIDSDAIRQMVTIPFGTVTEYDNTGRRVFARGDGTKVGGGKGFLHMVDERVANDYAELYLKGDKEGAIKKTIIDALRSIEAVRRGKIVERKSIDQFTLEYQDPEYDFETYRVVVSRNYREKRYELTTGYRKDDRFKKTKIDSLGKNSVAPRRSEFLVPEYYGSLIQALPRLTRQFITDLFPEMQGENNEKYYIRKLFTGARQSYAKPDNHFIGTGEGAQVYGWGLYSSMSRGVAKDEYARRYVRDYNLKRRLSKGEWPYKKPEVKLDGVLYEDFETFLDVRYDVSKRVWKAFFHEKPIERDASGNYIVDGHTITKDLLLYVAANELGMIDTLTVFNAWESKPYIDYRSADYYNEFIKDHWALNPTFELTGETAFYASERKKGPAKSKEAWQAFASKFFPDVNKNSKPVDLPLPAVMVQTWWTHRPEGDESHLLNWFEDISEENFQRVAMAAKDAGATEEELDDLGDSVRTGRDAYEWLGRFFERKMKLPKGEAKKAASEALYAHDIDGVKYPIGAFHNPTNKDGRKGWNFVAFSDEHLRVDHVYEYNPETDDFERKWHDPTAAQYRATERAQLEKSLENALGQTGGSRKGKIKVVRFFIGLPPILAQCGLSGAGIEALPSKLKYIRDHHHLDAAALAELPARLENPVAVFQTNGGRLAVLTDLLADDGTGRMAPVMAVLENGDAKRNARLVTAYSRTANSEGY